MLIICVLKYHIYLFVLRSFFNDLMTLLVLLRQLQLATTTDNSPGSHVTDHNRRFSNKLRVTLLAIEETITPLTSGIQSID